MIDFQLNNGNLVKQDSTDVELRGAKVKVEYRLHKDDFPDPKDPEGNGLTLFCLHVPQINQTYVDETEEKCFEALHECFDEDFIRHFAERLLEARKKSDGDAD